MNIIPIKNDHDYHAALAEIDKLMDAGLNTPKGDALDVWVTLAESYEAKQFPTSAPDSVNAKNSRTEQQG